MSASVGERERAHCNDHAFACKPAIAQSYRPIGRHKGTREIRAKQDAYTWPEIVAWFCKSAAASWSIWQGLRIHREPPSHCSDRAFSYRPPTGKTLLPSERRKIFP